MISLKISLNTIDKIKLFINDIHKLKIDFTLVSGRHTIPAKEITFLFCLNIYEPITLNIQPLNESPDTIRKVLSPYICK